MKVFVKFIFCLTFACLLFTNVAIADTPEELIQRYKALPKEEQNALKEKAPFFSDSFLEQYEELTSAQRKILIENYKIDLDLVDEWLTETETRLREDDDETDHNDRDLKNTKSKNNLTKQSPKKGIEEKDKKSNTQKQQFNQDGLPLEPKPTSEVDRLNEQFRSTKDERKVFSDVTEVQSKEEIDEKATKGIIDPTKKNKVADPNVKKGKPEETKEKPDLLKDKDEPEDGSKKLPKQPNLIDNKIEEALEKIKIETDILPYGYDLFTNEITQRAQTATKILVQDDYLLGPGDELVINLYGSKNNTYTLEVLKEGVINIPIIGPVTMNGLTFKEAKEKIAKVVQEKMLNTSVFVTSGKIKMMSVFLMGEFTKPGVLQIPSNATLMDALFRSEGIKEIGSLRNLQIKRNGETVSSMDLYDFLQRGENKNSLALKNGDVIFCPAIGATVTVMGAVLRPAKYELKAEKNIREVLSIAGAVTAKAYLKNVKVERIIDNLKRDVTNLDLASANAEQWNFKILDGDIITVPEVIYERSNSIFLAGNVKYPGVYSWREGIKLSDILKSVDDLLPQTEFNYAAIERMTNDKKHSFLISFKPEDILIKKQKDIALQANDKIIIYKTREFHEQPVVNVEGQIVNPGLYSFYEGMNVSDLILAGGGLREDAYKKRADLFRWVEEKETFQKKSIDLKDEKATQTILQNRDRLVVYSMWDVVQKEMVQAEGLVNKPGKYLYFEGMKVSDLLFAAGSLKEDANRNTANLHREVVSKNGLLTFQYIKVDLKAIFNKDPEADTLLKAKDKLEILEIKQITKDTLVRISGEVRQPSEYQWGEGMKISDLIRTAGGLEKSAYLKNAELIHHEVIEGEQRVVAHEEISLERLQAGELSEDRILKPYDEVHILKIPGWEETATIDIRGEVLYPGIYTIKPNERISDVIKRAGGLTTNAYAFAAFFSREKVRNAQKEQLDRRADELEKRMLNMRDTEGEVGKSTITKDNIRELVSRIRNTKVTGRVSFSLELAMDDYTAVDNLPLEGNDILIIPKRSEMIHVIGEVRNETSFILNKKFSMSDYVKKSGGYTSYADAKHAYVVRADGSVATFKSSGFRAGILLSNGKNIKGLMAGDTIVVPEKLDRYEGMKLAKDISQIFSQMALSIAAFTAIGVL